MSLPLRHERGLLQQVCPEKICAVGERGLILPLFGDSEQEWPTGLRIVLYMIGLAWTFMGVAIVADVFMGAIERITSKKKRIQDEQTGRNVTMKVWNDTVANLTLMALGSSAPEILLSVIELISGNMFSGELGPSTIVGSAAFNLFIISAVCVCAIPNGEIRKIKDTHVFFVTASFSIFAYLWLYFIVAISSENVIKLWEALLTFLMFPGLVGLAFWADRGGFSSKTDRESATHQTVCLADVSKDELAELEVKIRQRCSGGDVTDEQLAKLIEKEHAEPKTRAQYKVQAIRAMTAGKRVMSSVQFSDKNSLSSVVPCELLDGPTSDVNIKSDDIIIEFYSPTYAVLESVGTMNLTVKRFGNLDTICVVDYKSRDGTAMANSDYVPVEGTLEFKAGEETQRIAVTIIDDAAYEDDEDFFVDLTNARCNEAEWKVRLGRNKSAKVAIVDDDEPGMFRFQDDFLKVTESLENKTLSVTVRRVNGSTGKISCKYATEDATAIQGRDYEATEGTLEIANGETSGNIDLVIHPRGRYDTREEFRLLLTEAADPAKFDPTTDGGADSCILTIVIEADANEIGRVDRIFNVLQMDWDRAQIGHSNWRDQFREAFSVNGGDGDEDGDSKASPLDWAMHIMTLFWKVLFAIIPPCDFCDGWACFVVALGMIGLVTALIGDLAGLLGCVMGIPGPITAITFIALGTSLPDTFASKTAAEQDPYADASIGNITGSNSVNVFLGLGLPWTIGAIYWMIQDLDSTASKTWATKYPSIANDPGYRDSREFVVIGGDLGFSVAVFAVCAIVTVGTLEWRRKVYGGELGGPDGAKIATAALFIALWFLYIGLSAWKVMSNWVC